MKRLATSQRCYKVIWLFLLEKLNLNITTDFRTSSFMKSKILSECKISTTSFMERKTAKIWPNKLSLYQSTRTKDKSISDERSLACKFELSCNDLSCKSDQNSKASNQNYNKIKWYKKFKIVFSHYFFTGRNFSLHQIYY